MYKRQDRTDSSGVTECDYDGLSPHSLNLSGFYEKNGISVRLAYNWRDEFLIGCSLQQGRPESREAYGQLDLSASYDLNDTWQVFLEGVNLFDEDQQEFSVLKERFIEYQDTGSRFTFGVRGSF